jgi:16S rRNA (adenine1518-N6/adenine1519-N6)-dimethyltransferase
VRAERAAARGGGHRRARAAPGRPPAASGKTRALGQHFLGDQAVARRIVDLAAPTARDLVIEIGPGRGALTALLAERAGRLIALEIDGALAAALRARFAGAPHVEIRDADARSADYAALAASRPPGGRALAVGNLPYSAAKPILQALVEAGPALDEMVLMVQKEVAERLAAAPGGRDYGALSVLTQASCEVRLAFAVPPGAFRPPPRVESAVAHLKARAEPPVPVADPACFRRVVRAAFAQRRKTLANALAAGLALPAAGARALIAATGLDPGRRAETLTLAEFARLAAAVGGPGRRA